MCFWKNSKIIFANFFACCILQQNKTQLSILDLQGNVQLVVLFPQPDHQLLQLKAKSLNFHFYTQTKSSWCFQPEKKYAQVKWEKISSNLGMKTTQNIWSFPLPGKDPQLRRAISINLKDPKAAKPRCLAKMVLVSYQVGGFNPFEKYYIVEMGIFPK